jgi:alkanesulfonate monooxygenase SsuD/methylene tetrahydromethanopterin reductase-like flavin-dependent oxidoreductase (luciferase family)
MICEFSTLPDREFKYMMMSRLQLDCEAYIYGDRMERDLYYGNAKEHIQAVRELWDSFTTKPEWLPLSKLEEYERDFKNLPDKSM